MSEKPMPTFVDLSDEQLKQLQPLVDYAKQESAAGRKGMIVAQIGREFDGAMRVGFWDNTQSEAVIATFKSLERGELPTGVKP